MIDSSVPRNLRGDPFRLRQILLNLGSNAVKFTQHGKIDIHASVEKTEGSMVTLRFEIKDTGIGIFPDQIDKLFSSFTQLDSSTARKHGGTGLGLVIAKQLATMMGGNIGFQSKPSNGSIFWFTVNFTRLSSAAGSVAVVPRSFKGCDLYSRSNQLSDQVRLFLHPDKNQGRKNIRVLLAEDNPVNQKVTKAMFAKLGIELEVAQNGLQAILALSQKPFNMVLMDCQMPEMDGFAATQSHSKKTGKCSRSLIFPLSL